MNLFDFRVVFLASYKDHPRSRTTSLRQWCRELGLRIPSSSIAELTLETLMAMDPELLKSQHCHDTREFETLKYVLSRVLSELDKTLVIKTRFVHPHVDYSARIPNAFYVPAEEDEPLPDEEKRQSALPVHGDKPDAVDGLSEKPLHERFACVQQSFMVNPSDEIFSAELRSWLEPRDQHIPFELLGMSTSDILKRSFASFRNRWVGEHRLNTLVQLLERSIRSAVQSISELPAMPDAADLREELVDDFPYALTVDSWNRWWDTILHHEAGFITIGQAADALRELHATGILKKPIQTFAGLPLPLLEKKYEFGSAEYVGIVSAVRNLAEALTHFRLTENGTWQFLHANLWPIARWLEQLRHTVTLPTSDELMIRLWRPISWQLKNDLPQRLATVALMRLGENAFVRESTLEAVAQELGVSRERVRQLEKDVAGVLSARWPDVVDHLQQLHAKLAGARSTEAARVVDSLLTRYFAVTVDTDGSIDPKGDVLQQWQEAGRQRLTPMDDQEIAIWSAPHFPNISPQRVCEWIAEDSSACGGVEGRTIYFSKLPLDLLLLQLCNESEQLSLADAAALTGVEARSLNGRLQRDPRFVINDEGEFVWAERCGMKRFAGSWKLQLTDLQWISLELIIQYTMLGLSSRGIGDATIWGVHRYVREYLKAATGSDLPEQLTPVVLANVLVLHSDGLIRHMRRRRLRWDDPDSIHVARGKAGWVSHLVSTKGVPIALDELSNLLSESYQDYADHVVKQIIIATDEDGDFDERVRYFEGTRRRLPPILVPKDWTLNSECSNVSTGILRHAKRLRRFIQENRIDATEFQNVPWLLEVVQSEFLDSVDLPEKEEPEESPPQETTDETAIVNQQDSVGSPPVKSPATLTPVTDSQVTAVSQPSRRQKALPGLFDFRSHAELQILHQGEANTDLFNAPLDEPLVDLIAYVFGRILDRARRLHRPWSLVELRLTSRDLRWLSLLVEKLSPDEMMVFRYVENRFPEYSFDAQLGCILLLQISETGRRYAIDGELWSSVFRSVPWHPETKKFLFNGFQPNSRHRRMLESAAVELDLRRAFGEDSAQEWYQSIFLQFGFSRRGIERQLSHWIVGQHVPITILRLRDDPRHQSELFASLWKVMVGYRHGTETLGELHRLLEDSPWVLPDWHDAITQACRRKPAEGLFSAIESLPDTAPDSTVIQDVAGSGFLLTPMLDVDQLKQAAPRVEFRATIAELSNVAMTEDVYRIEIPGHSPVVLVKQHDGRYEATCHDVPLHPLAARLEVTLVAPSGEVVETQTLELWDTDEEVTAYNSGNGKRIDAWSEGLSVPGLLLIYAADLQIEPDSRAWAKGLLASGSYRCCVLDRSALASAKLSLGDETLWEPLLKRESDWIRNIAVEPTLSPKNDPKRLLIRIAHRPGVQITGVRFHGTLYECTPLRAGVSECRSIEIPESVRGADIVFVTVLAKCGDEYGRRRIRVSVQPEANLWRKNSHWEILRATTCADVTEIRNVAYRFWQPEPSVPDHTWHVFEGMQWIAPASARSQKLLELSGWGAPLVLRTGPYNSRDSEIKVLAEVTDHGVIQQVTFDADGSMRISIRMPIIPGTRHSVVLLSLDGHTVWIGYEAIAVNQQNDSKAQADEWIIDRDHCSVSPDLIVAVGIAYEGERLGSWWTESWAEILKEPAGESTNLPDIHCVRIAESIRWLHLPLLSSRNLRAVRDFAFRHTAPVLCSWLARGQVQEFACTETGESWNSVVRAIFADWKPSPTAAVQIDQVIEAAEGATQPVLWVSLQTLNQISPLVAARFVKQWLAAKLGGTAGNASQVNALVDVLRKRLMAGYGKDPKDCEEHLVTNIARDVSMSNGLTEGTCDFVREGLIEPAVRLLNAEFADDHSEWDRSNIAVAMKLPDFRTLVLLGYLKAIEETQ